MDSAHSFLFAALVAVTAACSSSSTSSGTPDAGGTPDSSPGVDASTDGGFDFTFTNSGSNVSIDALKVAPVLGSFCQGTSPKQCSFTGNVTNQASGCTSILNVAFVGDLTAGTSFPVVSDIPTAPSKGLVSYTETCNAGTTKRWTATGGTITLDSVTPPAQGFATGTLSLTVAGATMAVSTDAAGGGTAQGTFSISGKATNVGYTSPSG
jgi:hypothetical protein